MEQLVGVMDYVWMIAGAAFCGALGGLGFELMQVRYRSHTGAIEIPHLLGKRPAKEEHANNEKGTARPHKDRYFYLDLGVCSNIFLGAVTAVAVLYFFPPDTRTTIQSPGEPDVIIMSYNVVRLIAFSLIAGSAGPSFLASMQGRLVGALQTQKADVVGDLAQKQVTHIVEVTTSDLEDVHATARQKAESRLHQLRDTITAIQRESLVPALAGGNGNATEQHETQLLEKEIIQQVRIAIDDLHKICDEAEEDMRKRIQGHGSSAKASLTAVTSVPADQAATLF